MITIDPLPEDEIDARGNNNAHYYGTKNRSSLISAQKQLHLKEYFFYFMM